MLLQRVKTASLSVRKLSDSGRKNLLSSISVLLKNNAEKLIRENKKDVDKMEDLNPKKDRLILNAERIENLIYSLNAISELPDPSNLLLSSTTMQNGLLVEKYSVPMGVVGVIYESRPNVTIDVAALCLRSGNAVILRGGSEAENTNKYLVALIHEALIEQGLPEAAVTLFPSGREHVKELLEAVKYVDIIIPRGSQELIDFVRKNSMVPTIETGAGVCHTYVSESANLRKAAMVVVNAKVTRPSVCNSLDTIIINEKIADAFLPLIHAELKKFNVEIFADKQSYSVLEKDHYPFLEHATDKDFGREFLDFKCSIKTVSNLEEALSHIAEYSSRHSEAIISEDDMEKERFLNEVDAAAVYVNASTRFTDGGCFGLGAEIGISTQKLHARGPFALEKLVTEKWIVRGSGQTRN